MTSKTHSFTVAYFVHIGPSERLVIPLSMQDMSNLQAQSPALIRQCESPGDHRDLLPLTLLLPPHPVYHAARPHDTLAPILKVLGVDQPGIQAWYTRHADARHHTAQEQLRTLLGSIPAVRDSPLWTSLPFTTPDSEVIPEMLLQTLMRMMQTHPVLTSLSQLANGSNFEALKIQGRVFTILGEFLTHLSVLECNAVRMTQREIPVPPITPTTSEGAD